MAQVTFKNIYENVEEEVDNGATTHATLIKKLINRVYRKCLLEIVKLNRDFFQTSTTITLTSGTREYNFASAFSITDLMKVITIQDSNGYPLKKGSNRFDAGDYYLIGDTGIGFDPTPSAADTYTLYYVQRQDDLSDDDDEPSIEKTHRDILFYGACYLFYLNRKRLDLANYYKSMFDESWLDFKDWISSTLDMRDRVAVEDDGLE